MYWDVKTVKPLLDYCLYVEIKDGRKGVFDLKPYLDRGVFRELRDVHYFNRVSILSGAITWTYERTLRRRRCLPKYCHLIRVLHLTARLSRTR